MLKLCQLTYFQYSTEPQEGGFAIWSFKKNENLHLDNVHDIHMCSKNFLTEMATASIWIC